MDIKAAVMGLEGVEADAATKLVEALEAEMSKASKERDQAVHSRNEARAEQKALKDKVSELEGKVQEINDAGLSEQEKLTKEFEKLKADKEALAKTVAEKDAALERTTRDNAISQVHGSIKWNRDFIPAEDSLRGVNAALEGVDLTDKAAVDAAVKSYLEARPNYVLAEGASGAGTVKGGMAPPAVSLESLSGADLLKPENQLAILTADQAASA